MYAQVEERKKRIIQKKTASKSQTLNKFSKGWKKKGEQIFGFGERPMHLGKCQKYDLLQRQGSGRLLLQRKAIDLLSKESREIEQAAESKTGCSSRRQQKEETGRLIAKDMDRKGIVQCKIELPAVPAVAGQALPAVKTTIMDYNKKNRIAGIMDAVNSVIAKRTTVFTVAKKLSEKVGYDASFAQLSGDVEAIRDWQEDNRTVHLNEGRLNALHRHLNALPGHLRTVTEKEDEVMIEEAKAEQLDSNQRACFIEPVLNDSLYGGKQAVMAVTEIRRIIDRDETLGAIPVRNLAHEENPAMPTELPRIITYQQANDLNKDVKHAYLKKMITLAEDVTHWVKGNGRRIDSRTADRKESQNENYSGALRSIHQNIHHALPDNGEAPNPRWGEFSSEIELNGAVQEGGNASRFLEYTLWSNDRMVYDTVSYIAYFTEHYQFLNADYEAGGQKEDEKHMKNPFFGINMTDY